MRAFLDRWAPWIAGAVLLAGVCAYTATRLVGSGSSTPAAASSQTVPLDAQARAVAKEFVATAVARRNLGRAWTLAAPALRANMTRAQWLTGAIPVQPYPVAKARATYNVLSSTADDAELQVLFTPPPASSTPAGDFSLVLHRSNGTWQVTDWSPRQVISSSG